MRAESAAPALLSLIDHVQPTVLACGSIPAPSVVAFRRRLQHRRQFLFPAAPNRSGNARINLRFERKSHEHDHRERWHHDLLQGLGHRSEEHMSELQSQSNLVCRLLLEKKKQKNIKQ